MRENEKSILPNEAEAAFGVENAAEPERAESCSPTAAAVR